MSLGVFASSAIAAPIQWVPIGDPGNAPDTATNCQAADCGSVSYTYFIAKHEVTNAQYVEFLNAVAADDPNGLYHAAMGTGSYGTGITRSGVSGSYSYMATPGREDLPVALVSFYDSLRFANWLHNGRPMGPQGDATTENGAYTITLAGISGNSIARKPDARVFLPSENEWYKAAYYDPVSASYFEFPTGANTNPLAEPPPGGVNSANTLGALSGDIFNPLFNPFTEVGAYVGSAGPYGTFDQGGNVREWNEATFFSHRVARGGSWVGGSGFLAASTWQSEPPSTELNYIGFRVASFVPEPGTGLLVLTGLAGLAARRHLHGRGFLS
jgi:formylglycine-generating enzyme required for sulfatase activity